MKAEVRFESEAVTVAFADEGVGAEVRTRDIAEAEALRGRVKDGGVFLVEAENPRLGKPRERHVNGDLHVYVDEPVPEEIEELCSDRSGSFLLRVPSGRLSVLALGTGSPETGEPPEVHTFEVPPGDYSLSLLDGSIKDLPALTAQEKVLIDAADWRLHQRVDQLGTFGCLGVALGMAFVLMPYTRRNFWYLLPLFFLPTCFYSLLRRLPGYARVEERRREYEASLPQYVISMARVESTEGLEGGSYRYK